MILLWLEPARDALRADGILLGYTELPRILGPVEKAVCQQPGGSHADEVETSIMLYISPGMDL